MTTSNTIPQIIAWQNGDGVAICSPAPGVDISYILPTCPNTAVVINVSDLPTGWANNRGNLSLSNGQITIMPTPLATVKATKSSAVDSTLATIMAGGFMVPNTVSTTLAGKVLQTRDEDDKTNWLTSQASYSAAIMAGQANTMGARFRAQDNSTTTVSYGEGLNVLLGMAAWGAGLYNVAWSLKDQINAANSAVAVNSIDVSSNAWANT